MQRIAATIRCFRTARKALEVIDHEVHNAALEAIKNEINQRSGRWRKRFEPTASG